MRDRRRAHRATRSCEHVCATTPWLGWVFDAPPDTTIENYSLLPIRCDGPWRARMGTVATSGSTTMLPTGRARRLLATHRSRAFGMSTCFVLGNPAFPLAPANLFERSDLRILRVFLVNQCDGTECAPTGEWSHVTIWAARVGLSDPSAPRFTREPTGLRPDQRCAAVDGERPVTFAAEDRGGGIATVGFVVDGQIDAGATEPTGPERLARVRFVTPAPCPLVLERTMAFDTTQISNGSTLGPGGADRRRGQPDAVGAGRRRGP